MLDTALQFIADNRRWFDAAQAVSSAMSLLAWCLALPALLLLWRRGSISRINLGPLEFQIREAIEAAAAAERASKSGDHSKKINIPRIRTIVAPAFEPEIASNLIGKAVLWVDDNPTNNRLGVRALRSLQLDVEQVKSTEAALAAIKNRSYDLIISDMGRGSNMRAGYDLLAAIRACDPHIPFFIFAGSDTGEFRREAKQRGAQLSTNNMLELIDNVIQYLGERN